MSVITNGRLRPRALPQSGPSQFELRPSPEETDRLRDALGLLALRKLRLAGQITLLNDAGDWQLSATLGATVQQPCSVTLEPVTTRIDMPVERHYLRDLPEPEGEEVEIPEDDSQEALPDVIDLSALLAEELALALPAYPRAPGHEPLDISAAPPGAAPLQEAEIKPFAALAELRDKLSADAPQPGDPSGETDGEKREDD